MPSRLCPGLPSFPSQAPARHQGHRDLAWGPAQVCERTLGCRPSWPLVHDCSCRQSCHGNLFCNLRGRRGGGGGGGGWPGPRESAQLPAWGGEKGWPGDGPGTAAVSLCTPKSHSLWAPVFPSVQTEREQKPSGYPAWHAVGAGPSLPRGHPQLRAQLPGRIQSSPAAQGALRPRALLTNLTCISEEGGVPGAPQLLSAGVLTRHPG